MHEIPNKKRWNVWEYGWTWKMKFRVRVRGSVGTIKGKQWVRNYDECKISTQKKKITSSVTIFRSIHLDRWVTPKVMKNIHEANRCLNVTLQKKKTFSRLRNSANNYESRDHEIRITKYKNRKKKIYVFFFRTTPVSNFARFQTNRNGRRPFKRRNFFRQIIIFRPPSFPTRPRRIGRVVMIFFFYRHFAYWNLIMYIVCSVSAVQVKSWARRSSWEARAAARLKCIRSKSKSATTCTTASAKAANRYRSTEPVTTGTPARARTRPGNRWVPTQDGKFDLRMRA